MKKISISAVDLFCGIGGLTHGLIKSGVKVVAGIDVDEECRFAFEKNNDALFINKSVKEISSREVSDLYPKNNLKILVGCAPCQPFSKHTQKKRNRQENEDWGLLYHFLKLIKEVKPSVISMENVPQITKHKVFFDFVEGLKLSKFHVTWQQVFCPKYGIPQNRTRLVLLASRLGEINLVPPTHDSTNYPTVRMAIGGLESIRAGHASSRDRFHKSAILERINLERIKKSVPGGSWKDWDKRLRADCHRKESGSTYSSVYARMSWDKPSPTITTQFFSFGTGRFGHPNQNRAISIREGAILQTFPKDYKFIHPSTPVVIRKLGKQIGNAVPVQLGFIIGQSIKRHVEQFNG